MRPTALPHPFPKLHSRATLKGSGVRGRPGLAEDKAIVREGPSGQADRQMAAGAARASSRSSIWEGLGARVLTLEPPLHPLSLSQQCLPSPSLGMRPESATSYPLSSVLVPLLHSAVSPSCLPFLPPGCEIHHLCLWRWPRSSPFRYLVVLTHAAALPESQVSLPSSPHAGPFHDPLPCRPRLEPPSLLPSPAPTLGSLVLAARTPQPWHMGALSGRG